MFDTRLVGLGGGHQRDVLRDLGQHHGGELQNALQVVRGALEFMPGRPPDVGGRRLLVHEEVDKIAIPTIGRDAAGRRVRLLQVAGADQVRQFVADGGRGERHEVLGGQQLGTDRDPGYRVVGDHRPQDLLLTAGQRDLLFHLFLALRTAEC